MDRAHHGAWENPGRHRSPRSKGRPAFTSCAFSWGRRRPASSPASSSISPTGSRRGNVRRRCPCSWPPRLCRRRLARLSPARFSGSNRGARPCGLAVAVHPRGGPLGASRLRYARHHDGSTGTGEVARGRRTRVARLDLDYGRARRQGSDRDLQRLASARRPARARPGARLFRHIGRPLHARRLGPADHQELWPLHLRGGSSERVAADRRRRSQRPLVPAFGPHGRAALARHHRLPLRGRRSDPGRSVAQCRRRGRSARAG